MVLLHWSTLQPSSSSNIAAVRFAAPVRVTSLRIFPTGAQPFAQHPHIIASTEPDAFFLKVFFNAQPINPQQAKDKQRAVNALVPSVIAYSGGQVEFTVDIGAEYASRLMIIKGNFQKVSMAVYGDLISESSPVVAYEPKPLPVVESVPLSHAVDPANSSDPSELARKLLSLIPDSPSLPLVIRFMFCLKPIDKDWDHPDFPYLYAHIDHDEDFLHLESVVDNLSRPIPEDTTAESLEVFAGRIIEMIGPKDSDQAYFISRLISISASQVPDMARILLQHLELELIFDAQVIDETTTNRLLDAAANGDIARTFNNPFFLQMFKDAAEELKSERNTYHAINRLLTRIHGWETFEDALTNRQGDFFESAQFLKDIGAGEQSIGIWLESMIIHDDIATKLAAAPVLPSRPHPPNLLNDKTGNITHDEFISFVRAFIGIASVLAVWAWSDSIGNDDCRAQALAILQLWQNVSGYREIVNHLLLLRQLTRRLGWITSDNVIPRKSSILAERVLLSLTQEPHAILHEHFTSTVLALAPPLSHIPESERLTLRKISCVAEDGLSAALEELAYKSDHPLSQRRLRTLRASLQITSSALDENYEGDWHLIERFWNEQNQDLNIRLIDILTGVSQDLDAHFLVTSTAPPRNQSLVEHLFCTADGILHLLMRLMPMFPLDVRSLRTLIRAVSDVFACASMADTLYAQFNTACSAAQQTRQSCLEILRNSCEPECVVEPNTTGAEVVIKTLMKHTTESQGKDPVNHLLQIAAIIDHILPLPPDPGSMSDVASERGAQHWVTYVLPRVLADLKNFLRLLDVENRLHFLRRLIRLDEGTTAIGEWMLIEEMKHTTETLEALAGPSISAHLRLVLQHDVYLSLCVLHQLMVPESTTSQWCLDAIVLTNALSRSIARCLMGVLEGNYTCEPLTAVIKTLTGQANRFDEGLWRVILLGYLRVTQLEGLYLTESMQCILNLFKRETSFSSNTVVSSDPLHLEIARMLSALADIHSIVDTTLAGELLEILEWLTEQDEQGVDKGQKRDTVLYGISSTAFTQLCDSMKFAFLSNPSNAHKADLVMSLQKRISVRFVTDEKDRLPPFSDLPVTLQLSIETIEDILKGERQGDTGDEEKGTTPSTPKGSKTPDLLGVVISPPAALFRSPAATGLTKTYMNNDFRQLRQVPSSRLNTSRLPSMHGESFISWLPLVLNSCLGNSSS
ncbi:hypothetical protein AMATHDRAFT_142962 [Amanita thiersii Skay4041]|uniref:Virilizer N-terminal domain-containing protein n=1 Tax=Amanita thiersii Skay4041 TaxID=703135 RepID=A0A2A9NUG7_9AGAR|nr:hypothetical protein AMATHDRAFT_142962 [Amanita thiersii Skay4041]